MLLFCPECAKTHLRACAGQKVFCRLCPRTPNSMEEEREGKRANGEEGKCRKGERKDRGKEEEKRRGQSRQKEGRKGMGHYLTAQHPLFSKTLATALIRYTVYTANRFSYQRTLPNAPRRPNTKKLHAFSWWQNLTELYKNTQRRLIRIYAYHMHPLQYCNENNFPPTSPLVTL